MMRIQSGRVARAWEHAALRRWLRQRFPEHCWGKPREELDAYLTDRGDRARALGFESARHLQFLIDYELGSGLAVLDPCAGTVVPEVSAVLAQQEVDPEERIQATERLVFCGGGA